MFVFVPTGTDAPIYHWPFATGGLVVFHSLVLGLQYVFPEAAEWRLAHGS